MSDFYWVGQGKVFLRDRQSGPTGLPTGNFKWIGDTNNFNVGHSQDSLQVPESYSGLRLTALDVVTGTNITVSFDCLNYSAENLARFLFGVDAGSTAAGTVTTGSPETVSNVYADGGDIVLANKGISSVTVIESGGTFGVDDMTENTDYVVNGNDGTLTILNSGNWSSTGPLTLKVAYTHLGIASKVESVIDQSREFSVMLQGFSLSNPDKKVDYILHRVRLNMPEELSLIGTEAATLSLSGSVLPDDNEGDGSSTSKYYKVVEGN